MMVAFYIYKNDLARVEEEFVAFNVFFEEIVANFLKIFGKSLLFEEKAADTDLKKMTSLQFEGNLNEST